MLFSPPSSPPSAGRSGEEGRLCHCKHPYYSSQGGTSCTAPYFGGWGGISSCQLTLRGAGGRRGGGSRRSKAVPPGCPPRCELGACRPGPPGNDHGPRGGAPFLFPTLFLSGIVMSFPRRRPRRRTAQARRFTAIAVLLVLGGSAAAAAGGRAGRVAAAAGGPPPLRHRCCRLGGRGEGSATAATPGGDAELCGPMLCKMRCCGGTAGNPSTPCRLLQYRGGSGGQTFFPLLSRHSRRRHCHYAAAGAAGVAPGARPPVRTSISLRCADGGRGGPLTPALPRGAGVAWWTCCAIFSPGRGGGCGGPSMGWEG